MKSQVNRKRKRPDSSNTAALDKQHSNAEKPAASAKEGTAKQTYDALAEGIIAFECFGLPRVYAAPAL